MSGNAIEVSGGTGRVATAEEAGPHDLIRMALAKDVDVSVLERLVALEEQVQARNARAEFYNALAEFQAECPPIKKSKTAKVKTRSGSSYSYTYSSLDEIARTVRPLLHRQGLSYTWDSRAENGGLTCTCKLRHIAGHEEVATFACPTDTKADMNGAQATGAALTYARRQSLVQVLGLTTTDEDGDGQGSGPVHEEPGYITPEQEADLSALGKEVGADFARFLRYLKVGSLSELPASRYAEAVAALEAKRGRADG